MENSTFNHQGKFVCECGREFENSQAFNGHKSHCSCHLSCKYGEEASIIYKQRQDSCYKKLLQNNLLRYDQIKLLKRQKWESSEHFCKFCGKRLYDKFGSGTFCSLSCSSSYNNFMRMRSEDVNKKISQTLKIKYNSGELDIEKAYSKCKENSLNRYLQNPKKCKVCGNIIPYDKRNRKTCSEHCLQVSFQIAGMHSAQSRVKRSKNEIQFCSLCEDYFGINNVLHNEPMFNGWDADIIILPLKIAIMWNGLWHYKQISKSQSLKQVQNRDSIKQKEIMSCGYECYIIQDIKKSKNKPEKEFEIFLQYVKANYPSWMDNKK